MLFLPFLSCRGRPRIEAAHGRTVEEVGRRSVSLKGVEARLEMCTAADPFVHVKEGADWSTHPRPVHTCGDTDTYLNTLRHTEPRTHAPVHTCPHKGGACVLT